MYMFKYKIGDETVYRIHKSPSAEGSVTLSSKNLDSRKNLTPNLQSFLSKLDKEYGDTDDVKDVKDEMGESTPKTPKTPAKPGKMATVAGAIRCYVASLLMTEE